MKTIWINANPWNKLVVQKAIESGADAVLVDKGHVEMVRELGRIAVLSESGGDLVLNRDFYIIKVDSKEKELEAACLSKNKIVVIEAPDWKIIPLENLIAQSENIFAKAADFQEAKTALSILEKGCSGILLYSEDINEIEKTVNFVKGIDNIKLTLEEAEIAGISRLDMGDRVCIDTCSMMSAGEGMLVGNSSSHFFLVHSETVENPYVETRPFRINAGGIHSYILGLDGKTNYLSELRSGDSVLIVNHLGETKKAIIGRVKIEKRPMLQVEAILKKSGGTKFSLLLQNAETIRLTLSGGSPISVVKLKAGDKILSYNEKAGRHFGMKVDETIIEK